MNSDANDALGFDPSDPIIDDGDYDYDDTDTDTGLGTVDWAAESKKFSELAAQHEMFLMQNNMLSATVPSAAAANTNSSQYYQPNQFMRFDSNVRNINNNTNNQSAAAASAAPTGDLSAMLQSITSSKEADLLSAGMPLSSIDLFKARSAGHHSDDAGLDQFNLNSVLAALDEDEHDHHHHQQQHQARPVAVTAIAAAAIQQTQSQPQAAAAVLPSIPKVGGVLTLADLEAKLHAPPAAITTADQAQSQHKPTSEPPSQPEPAPVLVPLPPDWSPNQYQQQQQQPSLYIPLPSKHHPYMSKSEMALVIKLQLSQLQNTDLATDDFYNQIYTARRGGIINPHIGVLPPVLNQRGNTSERNPDGTIKFAAGTLGKLAAVSLRKPKKLMELGHEDQSIIDQSIAAVDNIPPRRFMFSNRSIHYLIEEGLRGLMELEDLDSTLSSINQQTNYYYQLIQQRQSSEQRLLESLDLIDLTLPGLFQSTAAIAGSAVENQYSDHLLFQFSSHPKGRLLIFRSLLLLRSPSNYLLLVVLLQNLPKLISYNPEAELASTFNAAADNRLYQLMADILYSMPLPLLTACFKLILTGINRNNLLTICRNKLGCMALQVSMKKAHDTTIAIQQIGQQIEQQPPQAQQALGAQLNQLRDSLNQWRGVYEELFTILIEKQYFNKLLIDLPKRTNTSQKDSSTVIEEKTNPNPTISSTSPAVNLASQSAMFELLAALISHARKEQRTEFVNQIEQQLGEELRSIYGNAINQPATPIDSIDPLQVPIVLPPLTAAQSFLATVVFSQSQPQFIQSIVEAINRSHSHLQRHLQAKEAQAQSALAAAEAKRNQLSFAQAARSGAKGTAGQPSKPPIPASASAAAAAVSASVSSSESNLNRPMNASRGRGAGQGRGRGSGGNQNHRGGHSNNTNESAQSQAHASPARTGYAAAAATGASAKPAPAPAQSPVPVSASAAIAAAKSVEKK